jgi:hypothetical protein
MVEYLTLGYFIHYRESKGNSINAKSCTNQEDNLIWRGTKNGVFFVCSAYYI